MSQLPLPPEIEVLLDGWRGRLPIGTTLRGYVSQDPYATVFYATQPSITREQQSSASVWISREAVEDLGMMPAVTPALAVLVDLAMRRAMPTTKLSEAAPMAAMMDSDGLNTYSPPIASPNEH